jgi:hypothetical protein
VTVCSDPASTRPRSTSSQRGTRGADAGIRRTSLGR